MATGKRRAPASFWGDFHPNFSLRDCGMKSGIAPAVLFFRIKISLPHAGRLYALFNDDRRFAHEAHNACNQVKQRREHPESDGEKEHKHCADNKQNA